MNVLWLRSIGIGGAEIYQSLLLDGFVVTGVARKNADVEVDISDDSSLIERV